MNEDIFSSLGISKSSLLITLKYISALSNPNYKTTFHQNCVNTQSVECCYIKDLSSFLQYRN